MDVKGHVNEYTCRTCKCVTHTINLSTGTTPFGICCPACGHFDCFSGFYRLTRAPNVSEAFYRPETLPQDKDTADFLIGGALIHAPLEKACSEVMRNDPITPGIKTHPAFLAAIGDRWKLDPKAITPLD